MIGSRQEGVKMVGRTIRRVVGAALPLLAASMVPSTGWAGMMDPADDELVIAAQALPDAALEERRGGFKVGRFDIALGGDIESTIDGVTRLVSTFTFYDRDGRNLLARFTSVGGTGPAAAVVQGVAGASSSTTGADITHDLTNGITAIIRNRLNNVTAEQTITINATVNNFATLAQQHRIGVTAARLADQIQQFRPSR